MLRFVIYRVLQFPLILAVIYLLTFMLAWVAPGTPFEQNEKMLAPGALEDLKRRFHAERWQTFLEYYPIQVLHGDFGPSMKYEGWTVTEIIRQALPVSMTLGLAALALATFAGVGIGTLAAVRRGGAFDFVSLTVALVGVSVPSFVVASLLLLGCAGAGRWFPIGSWGKPADLILPAAALALTPMAYIARLTRVSMLDVLSSDYVRTARAKGLSRWEVVWKHCLRNALVPVLSFLGPAAAITLTGSFVVEKVFNIPGLGRHFVNSVLNHDQTLILGTVMVYATFLLALNLIVDVAYAFVDPRIDVTAREQ